jgi:hypothetical protein
MTAKDALHTALELVQESRYSESSQYLADIVASLAMGGSHRKVDLSRLGILDEHAQAAVLELITAKFRGIYADEVWQHTADKILETVKGR